MMQTTQKRYKTLTILFVLIAASNCFANGDPQIEKKKTYTKTYSISTNDKVSLTNQFGEVRLVTWNRNEVKVDVDISAKADSEQRATEILNNINIEDGQTGNGVWFKTEMDNKSQKKNGKNYKNEGFSINYRVSIPSVNTLYLQNSFGSIHIPDYKGQVEIESKFGSLEAGNLSNTKSVLVEFGKADIASVHNGKLIIKFSGATINRMSGDISGTFEHSGGIKLGITNSLKALNVRNNFSTLYLDVEKGYEASYDINTSFGEFTNQSAFEIRQESDNSHGPKFDHRYTGKSGNGNSSMKIRSEFGKIVFGHNLEMKADDNKSKKKIKTI